MTESAQLDRPRLLRLWERWSNQGVIVAFVACVYLLPVASGIYQYVHPTRQPMITTDLAGHYVLVVAALAVAVTLSFLLVRPAELGLFLNKSEKAAWKREGRGVLVPTFIAIGTVLVANMARSMWLTMNPEPLILRDAYTLLDVLRSGVFEEIAAAALLVLCLRARWTPAVAVGLVVALRALWHAYQGTSAIPWAAFWALAFALIFLRYRRVTPLIYVHTAANVPAWLIYGT